MVRILASLENPSSLMRPFSKASSVARLIPAFFAKVAWLWWRLLRLEAIWVPIKDRSNTMPNILGRSLIFQVIYLIY